jgi:glucosylceramidase
MVERKRLWQWVAAGSGLAVLLVVAALYWSRPRHPAVAPAPPPPVPRARSVAQVWISTADRRLRLAQRPDAIAGLFTTASAEVVVDVGRTYQSIEGFGAALTDSSAWLLQHKLSEAQRAALLRELFGPSPGLNFSLLRLTIGASDFSLTHYTLDDMPAGETDPQLAHFNVAPNLDEVIPSVRAIMAVNPDLRIIASSWSAPAWMKSSANLIGGTLLPEYESVYADYLVKYVDTYRRYGIPIFALTLQNEPAFLPLTYPGMELPAEVRARIIGQYLGPALATRKPKTRIWGWDHNWDTPEQPATVLGDADAAPYVDGIAWHCYRGAPGAQSVMHRQFPRKVMFITECSGGDWESSRHGELMWFARDLLLGGLRNWARGVLYWNLALDEQYGPHLGGCNTCKGVVTIDSRTGTVSRNDYYYAFGHFSRFVLPGAVRVGSSATGKGIDNVAFRNADGGTVVLVVTNSNPGAHRLSVAQGSTHFQYDLPAQSVATFVWQPPRAIPEPFPRPLPVTRPAATTTAH